MGLATEFTTLFCEYRHSKMTGNRKKRLFSFLCYIRMILSEDPLVEVWFYGGPLTANLVLS